VRAEDRGKKAEERSKKKEERIKPSHAEQTG
jgi:hypothetical protein